MTPDKTVSFVQMCIVAFIVGIVTALVVLVFQKPDTVINQQAAGASPAGSTFTNAKFSGITFSLATATSTTIVNTDSNDRYIVSMELACSGIGTSQTAYTGAGLASVTFKGATTTQTTSGAAQIVTNTTSLAFNTTLATTTPGGIYTIASSTLSLGALPAWQLWPAGLGLTMFTNATNTAVCTGGVRYLGS